MSSRKSCLATWCWTPCSPGASRCRSRWRCILRATCRRHQRAGQRLQQYSEAHRARQRTEQQILFCRGATGASLRTLTRDPHSRARARLGSALDWVAEGVRWEGRVLSAGVSHFLFVCGCPSGGLHRVSLGLPRRRVATSGCSGTCCFVGMPCLRRGDRSSVHVWPLGLRSCYEASRTRCVMPSDVLPPLRRWGWALCAEAIPVFGSCVFGRVLRASACDARRLVSKLSS